MLIILFGLGGGSKYDQLTLFLCWYVGHILCCSLFVRIRFAVVGGVDDVVVFHESG